MTRPRTVSVNALIVSLMACSSTRSSPRMHARAFPKRSFSAGLVQKTGCRLERGEMVARGDGLDEVPELLPQRLIVGVSTGQRVQSPKLQPARALGFGDLDSSPQRRGGLGCSAAVGQLAVDSPQLSLEIALVAAM